MLPIVDLRLVAALGAIGIGRMYIDGHSRLFAQTLREAHVVAVAVGEDDATHVGRGAPHGGELPLKIAPVAGQPGVDERDALVGVDEVRGDDVVADAVQMGTDLHGASFLVVEHGTTCRSTMTSHAGLG